MDSGYLQIIGRPGSGKSTLISKVDELFSNCDSHLFNVKSEVNRLGSVDFLVPLLKTCSKVVSLSDGHTKRKTIFSNNTNKFNILCLC